jgi:uncharacterized protein YhbP (UPF0306 family)
MLNSCPFLPTNDQVRQATLFNPMAHVPNIGVNEQIMAHVAAETGDVARLRALSMRERSRLIESACEAASAIYRSRLAAGLPGAQRAPWPASTWEFFRKQAARVRS